jgi:hypothetical protein
MQAVAVELLIQVEHTVLVAQVVVAMVVNQAELLELQTLAAVLVLLEATMVQHLTADLVLL